MKNVIEYIIDTKIVNKSDFLQDCSQKRYNLTFSSLKRALKYSDFNNLFIIQGQKPPANF